MTTLEDSITNLKQQKTPSKKRFCGKNKPGTELLSQGATPQVSSPQKRFTSEFGMGSVWVHFALSTRKAGWEIGTFPKTIKTAQFPINFFK
jgi:hypothetical protein